MVSIIKKPLYYEGSQGDAHVYTLFDSGVTFSCMRPDLAERLEKPVKLRRPLDVSTAAEGTYLRISERIVVDFYMDDVRLSDEFLLVPGLSEEAILGVNTFQKWRIKLDFEHDKAIVDPKVAMAMLKYGEVSWKRAL